MLALPHLAARGRNSKTTTQKSPPGLGAILLTMAQESSWAVHVVYGCVQGSLRFIFYLEALFVGIARLWLSLPNTTFQQSSLS